MNPLTTTVPPARLARERRVHSPLLQILEITRTAISYTLRGHMSSSSLIKHTQVHQGPPFPHMDIPGCRDVQISNEAFPASSAPVLSLPLNIARSLLAALMYIEAL